MSMEVVAEAEKVEVEVQKVEAEAEKKDVKTDLLDALEVCSIFLYLPLLVVTDRNLR